MNITGIIAEYNPFHNGHAYQLACAKEETDADYTVIILSGNFVQRGAPALLDKFIRAKMALLEGADLVIELPVLWSTASAQYFASAGVALLEQLGCVDVLCYGCETPDGVLFEDVSRLLSHETPAYKAKLAEYLKEGTNYALAREKAVLQMLPETTHASVMEIMENPNNILALEYQKAAARQASLKMHPIQRKGQGYHSKDLSGTLVCASAIRRYLFEYENARPVQTAECHIQAALDSPSPLVQAMPLDAYRLLMEYRSHYPFLFENDCSQMLHYCLIKNASDGFFNFADCTIDFSNKICRYLDAFTNFQDFCALLKSKDLAYSRISRMLLHILLDIRKDDCQFWREHNYVPYARVLGFRKESRGLLTHLKKHASLPLLAHAADAKKILPKEEDYAFFQKNLFADSIYRGLVRNCGGQGMANEFRQQIIVV